jgi:hypothetical protein
MVTPNIVPASIQRVRRFLAVEGGMRIEPWASVDETLDAFHDLLLSHHRDDAFWKGLEGLLCGLSDDMRRRSEGALVDNEVLDTQRHEALLAEIRSALEGRSRGRGGFRRLAASLSMPAVGLLFLMGGIATAGCEEQESELVTAADTTTDTAPDVQEDTSTTPDTPPDTRPERIDDVGCDATIEEMIEMCVTSETRRSEISACLSALDSSWRSGLAEYLACEPCYNILHSLDYCLYRGFHNYCADPASEGAFDLDVFIDNCVVPIYLGLKFE